MTSFQLLLATFSENVITRAERRYQQRSTKKRSRWRRLLTRVVMYFAITVALIEFGGLLAASLTGRDPTPLAESLGPLPTLFIIVTLSYHLSLMFQTISLSAHSITREREAQTWEMLVLTGIDARQIVRSKWWATVQRQLPRYALLALLRTGMIAAAGIATSAAFNFAFSQYYGSQQIKLQHPLTILFISLIGVAYTFANLGLSAASGVMASAVSHRSSVAILRGFANQIVISVASSVAVLLFVNRLFDFRFIVGTDRYITATNIPLSLFDNGMSTAASAIGPSGPDSYTQLGPSVIKPIAFEWIVVGLISIALYGLMIWFALWRAERRAVRALATPFDKSLSHE